ncbi:MAG: DUF2279 domain-containing protein [Deltaproteobacteria bacterium]|nr:DUF2279 domain-containing protein [Deltaproteobacteria bacterium]
MKPVERILLTAVSLTVLFGFIAPVAAEEKSSWYKNLPKENKAVLLNAAAGAVILTWGALSWDYGERNPHFQSEGWFEKDSPEGGADKVGHVYTGYALSHLFYYRYKHWGYDEQKAIRLGSLSSLGVTTLMEIGDSFSHYGFSCEDELFNILGAVIGYYLVRYPEAAGKIDFRVEYDPFREGKHKRDFLTDYERIKYLFAVKFGGFDALRETYLKYFEFQVGYYARGYDDYDEDTGKHDGRRRKLYAGIGLNIGSLLGPFWKTKLFNYVQVPYTYVPVNARLD